jgi:hypothetical protein
VKMLKRRSILQGTAPAAHTCRFELEFLERTMTTQEDYPVVLYDEV